MMMDVLSADIHRGIRPWDEPVRRLDGNAVLYGHPLDSPAQIKACLECRMGQCINCVDIKSKPYRYEKRNTRVQKQCLIRDRIEQMLKKCMGRQQICDELNISKRTYFRYLSQIKEREAV